MGTLSNVILQGFTDYRRELTALVLFVLEATSFVVDQIGGNQFGFLVASFVLSVINSLMTGYIAIGSKTDLERDRIMIELAFSVVQLILTYLYLVLSTFRVKLNIASIFPLVLAGTTLILAFKRNEQVQHPTPNTQERDEEEGSARVLEDRSRVNREEVSPDPGIFISHVGTSTEVDETRDSCVPLPVTTQSSIIVNVEETARVSKQEEISEKSLASLISSGTSSEADETPESRVLPVTTQSSIMINVQESARVSKQEEISEKSIASLISSGTSTEVDETPESRVFLPVTTQPSIMVNVEETARVYKQEEISEKSKASLISSDAPPMMSKDEKIAIPTAKRSTVTDEIADPTVAPTTPAISF